MPKPTPSASKRGLRPCEYDWLSWFYTMAGTHRKPARDPKERDLLKEVAALRPDLLEIEERPGNGLVFDTTFRITSAGVAYVTGRPAG